ncbi:MAG TPA: hypothetical protein VNW95_10690 [Mucilaginibacter sp.]|jgi:hypothetical protein|nr:hypothetical protein [Mucilaginibacter sp.]
MTKKYILKPGKHQFAPRSPAVHEDDSLGDEEAEWYLQRYPHIAGLFLKRPDKTIAEGPEKQTRELNESV